MPPRSRQGRHQRGSRSPAAEKHPGSLAPSKKEQGIVATKKNLRFFCNSKPQSMPQYFFYEVVEIGPNMQVYRDAIFKHIKEVPTWVKPVHHGGEWQIRYTVPLEEASKS